MRGDRCNYLLRERGRRNLRKPGRILEQKVEGDESQRLSETVVVSEAFARDAM